MTVWELGLAIFCKSVDLFSVGSLLSDLESFKTRLKYTNNRPDRRRRYTIDPTKEYKVNIKRAMSIQERHSPHNE
jgi:hypothetical protein